VSVVSAISAPRCVIRPRAAFVALALALALAFAPLGSGTARAAGRWPGGTGPFTAGTMARALRLSPLQSGLTSVELPQQVTSGGRLTVVVSTAPHARLTIAVAYPDGRTTVRYRRANGEGSARVSLDVTYQPPTSAESILVTVHAVRPATQRAAALDDTVTGKVTVLQHIVLSGHVRVPPAVLAGGKMRIVVTSNQVGAQVRLRLTHADGQVEVVSAGAIDGRHMVTYVYPVPVDERGPIGVQAVISYWGVDLNLPDSPDTVTVRAQSQVQPKARKSGNGGHHGHGHGGSNGGDGYGRA